jgi:hypothetical protein
MLFCIHVTLGLTLSEEHRLRVSGNRVLRIFGPKKEEVAGGWRRLHNEALHNLCTLYQILLGKGRDHSEDLGIMGG